MPKLQTKKLSTDLIYVRYRDANGKKLRRRFKNEADAEMFYLRKHHELFNVTESVVHIKLISPKRSSALSFKPQEWAVKYFDSQKFTIVTVKFTNAAAAERFYLLYSHDYGNPGDGTLQIVRPGQPESVECLMCERKFQDKGYQGKECKCGNPGEIGSWMVPQDSRHNVLHLGD
jgi:hypothetical protein